MELDNILNDIDLTDINNINIIEIGTGKGDNSTVVLYNYFKLLCKPFIINSYEGHEGEFKIANKYWENKKCSNVNIINEYVSNKKDIKDLLIPNLPPYIKDYKEGSARFVTKYMKLYDSNITNYITNFRIEPTIIFIDCSRFMHLSIINKCYEINNNSECVYIIEDDYCIDEHYGELEIIIKYFKIKNIKKYNKNNWQWPFVSFQIEHKY